MPWPSLPSMNAVGPGSGMQAQKISQASKIYRVSICLGAMRWPSLPSMNAVGPGSGTKHRRYTSINKLFSFHLPGGHAMAFVAQHKRSGAWFRNQAQKTFGFVQSKVTECWSYHNNTNDVDDPLKWLSKASCNGLSPRLLNFVPMHVFAIILRSSCTAVLTQKIHASMRVWHTLNKLTRNDRLHIQITAPALASCKGLATCTKGYLPPELGQLGHRAVGLVQSLGLKGECFIRPGWKGQGQGQGSVHGFMYVCFRGNPQEPLMKKWMSWSSEAEKGERGGGAHAHTLSLAEGLHARIEGWFPVFQAEKCEMAKEIHFME
eukprot:1155174-Pelagomonas_calceolata.AAC.4